MKRILIEKLSPITLLIAFALTIVNAKAQSDFLNFDNNVEIGSTKSKLESLKIENKINKSLFLPELNLIGGLGSEKLQENSYETETGPFLFLESKLNIYRGGRDSSLNKKNNLEIFSMNIELEIKKRELNISSFKILSAINLIKTEKKLIDAELSSNKIQQSMARKKLNAGLTSSIDLIDFDIKNDYLINELDILDLKIETLKKEFAILYGNEISNIEMETMFANISKSLNDTTIVNFENSPSFKLSQKQIDLITINQESVKSEYLPSIDLEAKWGHISPQERFTNSPREHQIALNVTFPLFTGYTTDYKFKQSVIESTQKKRELKQIEVEAKLLQELETKKIELSKKLILSLNHSLSQSVKYKDLTIGEYRRGIKNSSDIISASDKKLELERKILETQNELKISQITLNESFKPYSGE